MIFHKLKLCNPTSDTVALDDEFIIQGTKEAALAARETWKQTGKLSSLWLQRSVKTQKKKTWYRLGDCICNALHNQYQRGRLEIQSTGARAIALTNNKLAEVWERKHIEINIMLHWAHTRVFIWSQDSIESNLLTVRKLNVHPVTWLVWSPYCKQTPSSRCGEGRVWKLSKSYGLSLERCIALPTRNVYEGGTRDRSCPRLQCSVTAFMSKS